MGHHALLQGIFLTQGSNPDLPCRRQIPYRLGQLITKRKKYCSKNTLTHTQRGKNRKRKTPLTVLTWGPVLPKVS